MIKVCFYCTIKSLGNA